MGILLSDPIDAPCTKCNKCPMREEYCGIPVWRHTPDDRKKIYAEFVSWTKTGKDWLIKWNNAINLPEVKK